MPRAIHMAIVPVLSLVLNVRGIDRDPTGSLLRRVVDLLIGLLLRIVRGAELTTNERDGSRQSCLAVVDMSHSAKVDVVFGMADYSRSTSLSPLSACCACGT